MIRRNKYRDQADVLRPVLNGPESIAAGRLDWSPSWDWLDSEDLPYEEDPGDSDIIIVDLMTDPGADAGSAEAGSQNMPKENPAEQSARAESQIASPEITEVSQKKTSRKKGRGKKRDMLEKDADNRDAETDLPSTEQLSDELKRERYKIRYHATIRSTIFILITVAAAAVLAATFLFPFFRIYGTSMNPTLEESDVVMGIRTDQMETGDLIAFYYNNKILVKRVIASSGQWVDIDEDGNVFVDGDRIDEPYLTGKAKGSCDISLPYQVPDESVFVMGDHREVSIDSRISAIGCVKQDQVAGKLVLRIWPLNHFGMVR